MANYPTPHIDAKPGDFGRVVLMPGDPLRSEFIAKTYLEHPILVNNVRGVQGYTGKWQGKTVSVMASGMGMPSISIYSHELFHFFDVDAIIRVGSAGGLQPQVHLEDIILGKCAFTNSSYVDPSQAGTATAPFCDDQLLQTAVSICQKEKVPFHVGNLISTDWFYNEDPDANKKFAKMGNLAVEMEAAALYRNAMQAGKKALAICTVSDHVFTGGSLSASRRQTGFGKMAQIALKTAENFLKEQE